MPYQALIRYLESVWHFSDKNIIIKLLESIRDIPPAYHFLFASAVGTGTYVMEQITPNTWTGIAGVLVAVGGLLGAIRAIMDTRARNARMMKKLEAMLEARVSPVEKKTRDVEKRSRINGKLGKSNRDKLIKVESKLKEQESLRKVGLLPVVLPPRILFVDDNRSLLSGLERAFRKNLAGHCVLSTAESFEEAESRLQEPQDFIVLDLKLNGRSGLDLVPLAREQNPKVWIQVITGYDDESDMTRARELGVEVWKKPPGEALWLALFRRLQEQFGGPPSSGEIPILSDRHSRAAETVAETDGDGSAE